MNTAIAEFHNRIDDVVLLGLAAARDEEIDFENFFEREFADSLARLAERDLIERVPEDQS